MEALPGTSLSAVQYSTVRDTTDRVGLSHTGCRSAGQLTVRHHAEQQDKHKGLYRDLAGDWWFRLHGALLLHVHTVLLFMNINLMFT